MLYMDKNLKTQIYIYIYTSSVTLPISAELAEEGVERQKSALTLESGRGIYT